MKKFVNIIKNQNGAAITTLVAITLLTFFVILFGIYLTTSNLRKSQLESDIRIQEIYAEDVNRVDEIYEELTALSYDNPYIPDGFTYVEGTWNSGYVIQETSTGNEFVWVPCVLDQAVVKSGDTVVTFGKTLPTTTSSTDVLYRYNTYNLGLLPTDATVTAEDSTVEEIETSVGLYGGFYIARYEAGIEGTTDNYSLSTRTATDGSVKPLSQSGKGVWNSITRVKAITVSKAMVSTTDGTKSTLISGECWDTTLQWMVNASDNNETNTGYDTNSTGKGWYYDISSNTIHTTGYYSVNNIYDMGGNVFNWTTENCTDDSTNYAVCRGGDNTSRGYIYPAASRDYQYENAGGDYIGFRPVLYKE